MINITNEFKGAVVEALLKARDNFSGTDSTFAKRFGINNSVYSRLKSGEIEGLLSDSKWLDIGRELDVQLHARKWQIAKTDVYKIIERDILFCQQHSKAKIFVDDCGIGKTVTAKHMARTLKNCFYIDASQAKTKQLFITLIAKTLGIATGKYADMKANIKYYLRNLPNPMIIIDEAGDLEYNAFLEIKEFWNAAENGCGWYLIGADGLREKIRRGINSKKVGYREIFSRFSENYSFAVPYGTQERLKFYENLVTQVLSVNMQDKSNLGLIVKKSIVVDEFGNIGGLRRAESFVMILEAND